MKGAPPEEPHHAPVSNTGKLINVPNHIFPELDKKGVRLGACLGFQATPSPPPAPPPPTHILGIAGSLTPPPGRCVIWGPPLKVVMAGTHIYKGGGPPPLARGTVDPPLRGPPWAKPRGGMGASPAGVGAADFLDKKQHRGVRLHPGAGRPPHHRIGKQ